MTLKLNFVVQFGSKTISCRGDEIFINEDRDFLALFFASDVKKYSHKRERTTRERTTTRTTENEEDDDNHDDATTTRNAKTNDGRGEYHPVGRGRFGTTGDE